MVQFVDRSGQPVEPVPDDAARMRQPQPPVRYHDTPEDQEIRSRLQRGGIVNLHALQCFMVTEGTGATGRRPAYRGIVFARDGGWEAMQWNGLLRGTYQTRDQAIKALLLPIGRTP